MQDAFTYVIEIVNNKSNNDSSNNTDSNNKEIWNARWVIVEIIVPRCYENCYNPKRLRRGL